MTLQNTIVYKKIYTVLKNAKNILLVCHERPDGDTLGSVCALIDLCLSEKKKYAAYCKDQPPVNFLYLPHSNEIISDRLMVDFFNFDLIIAVDCGDIKRTGLADEIMGRKENQIFVNIDHHPKVEDYADIEIKDQTSSSTTMLVYDFFKINGLEINKQVATSILTGISVDTGHYLYATTDKTVKISSEMLTHGARIPVIMEKTWRNKTMEGLKLWGKAMARLETNEKYDLAFTYLKKEEASRVDKEELEGLSNFLGNMYGVKGLVLLIQKDDNLIKGSIRSSHPTVDISLLARIFGGGGHAKASGFVMEGRIVEEDGKVRIV